MKSIELCLSLSYMSYMLKILNKFTFLRGLSGSGKTTVGDLINAVKTNSTEIKYISEGYRFLEVMALPYLSKEELLRYLMKSEDNLYFIDGNYLYIDDSEFIDTLFQSRNYFIIVTRDRGFKGYIHDVNSFKKIKTEYNEYHILSYISDYYEDSIVVDDGSIIGLNIPRLKGFKEITDSIDEKFERVYHGKVKVYSVFDVYQSEDSIIVVGSRFSFIFSLSDNKYICCTRDGKLASNFMLYLKETKVISLP